MVETSQNRTGGKGWDPGDPDTRDPSLYSEGGKYLPPPWVWRDKLTLVGGEGESRTQTGLFSSHQGRGPGKGGLGTDRDRTSTFARDEGPGGALLAPLHGRHTPGAPRPTGVIPVVHVRDERRRRRRPDLPVHIGPEAQ